MVYYSQDRLDRIFAALSDPTRRAILAQLSGQEALTVSELAAPFPVSLPAVMKHLNVLSDVGLITREKSGRVVACRLDAAPMQEAMNWLNRYARFWSGQLDRLAALVEEETCPPALVPTQAPAPPSSRASRSNVVSMPRRKKSTPRGRSPKK